MKHSVLCNYSVIQCVLCNDVEFDRIAVIIITNLYLCSIIKYFSVIKGDLVNIDLYLKTLQWTV